MGILDYFRERAFSTDPNTHNAYVDHPSQRTIEKYMAKAQKGQLLLIEQRREFVYPLHMGSGEDRVPWGLARFALDCLHLYTTNHNVRPSIGLTKRFAQIANVSQQPEPMDDRKRAIMAEKFWYADLIASTPSRQRPSTEYEELSLAAKSWTSHDVNLVPDLAEQMGAEPWEMPEADFGFLKHMPEFSEEWEFPPPTNTDLHDEERTQFESWYTRDLSARSDYFREMERNE